MQVFRDHAPAGAYRSERECSMANIGEPLRIIEVEPREEPLPEKEVPFEQPADPVKEPA